MIEEKKDCPSLSLYQLKADLDDAMEALEHHDSQQMGFCDFETAANLENLADYLEGKSDRSPTGTYADVAEYLRDLAKLHSMRGKVLAPPEGFRGPRLEFFQKGRGRRSDREQFWKDASIEIALDLATLELGKQEAALEALKPTKSRASIFRAKRRIKSPSHKRR